MLSYGLKVLRISGPKLPNFKLYGAKSGGKYPHLAPYNFIKICVSKNNSISLQKFIESQLMKIIGRNREVELLKKASQSPGAELIAVYGRRRIGKTFLVKEFFQNKFDFYATGVYEGGQKEELKAFCDPLVSAGVSCDKVKDWMDAFRILRDFLKKSKKKRLVIFLDELPWFDVPPGHFLKAFEWFWNSWASTRPGLKMIVCGSATTWMVDKFIHNKGGLYNRTSLRLHLAPFDLHDSAALLRFNGLDWDASTILDAYMVMGGVPYYLNMLERDQSLDANIDRLFFSKNAPLAYEYEFLMRSLFRNAEYYMAIIDAVASKNSGITREEIVSLTGISNGGGLTKALKNLVRCDFLNIYDPFGKKTKGSIYQLTDVFVLFFKRFVEKYNGKDEHHWTNLLDSPDRRVWSGIAFEQVCLLHIPQIKEALGINGVLSNVSGWSYHGDEYTKGTQVDLVISRRDKVINLCEMKYSSDPYTVTKKYEAELKERREIFREATNTRSALHLTLVTPIGLKMNSHSQVFNQVITLQSLID